MIKTRTLGTDPGDRADFKYYSSSSSLNTRPPYDKLYIEAKDNYMSKYLDGLSKAKTLLGGIKPTGSQTFQSTTRRKPYFNDCSNVKLHGFCYPYLQLLVDYSLPGTAYLMPYWRRSIPFTDLSSLPTGEPAWAAAEGSQRRAWWSMQPRFEGEVSMLNFIFELKDFKELMHIAGKTPYGWADKYSRLGRKMHSMVKDYKTLTVVPTTAWSASKIWANLRLANEFALKPLIKDIKAITDQLTVTAEAAQDEYVKRGLEPQISHFSETLDESFAGTWGTKNEQSWFTGMYQKTLFTATMEYRYNTDLRSGAELFKRYWGLNTTGGVLWEATPFSFLADYFIKIGKAIHAMDLDPNTHTTMMQYCESLSQQNAKCVGCLPAESHVTRFYCPSDKHFADYTGFRPVSGIEWTFYNRRVTYPNKGSALPRITVPSKGQQMNMLALVRGMMP